MQIEDIFLNRVISLNALTKLPSLIYQVPLSHPKRNAVLHLRITAILPYSLATLKLRLRLVNDFFPWFKTYSTWNFDILNPGKTPWMYHIREQMFRSSPPCHAIWYQVTQFDTDITETLTPLTCLPPYIFNPCIKTWSVKFLKHYSSVFQNVILQDLISVIPGTFSNQSWTDQPEHISSKSTRANKKRPIKKYNRQFLLLHWTLKDYLELSISHDLK